MRNPRATARRLAAVLALVGLIPLLGDGPGTTVLFDGATLQGWESSKFGKPGEVKVEDGTIVLGVGRRMTGITTTRTDLPKTNYELSYEAKRLEGKDFFAAATFPVGESFATLVNGGWGGNVTGISSINGSDASENETTTFVKYEDGPWYAFRVRVTNDAIRCWVDQKRIIDVTILDRQIKTRIESRASQPLGFSSFASAGALRHIQMRPLNDEEIREMVKPRD